MDDLFQSVQKIQSLLDTTGIPSIVIGGIAVAIWGEPRLTRDIDLKVLLSRDDANRLLTLMSADYTSLLPDPHLALKKQGILFVQDQSGARIDLLLADTPYDVLAIERGREIEVRPELSLRICSPEDLVIYKMISTRRRDHEDVEGILLKQGDGLDSAYILDWLHQFEQALDDSTLVAEYLSLSSQGKG
jgi:hypothetical protein